MIDDEDTKNTIDTKEVRDGDDVVDNDNEVVDHTVVAEVRPRLPRQIPSGAQVNYCGCVVAWR